MKSKTIIILLSILLVIQSFAFVSMTRAYINEHDLNVLHCETENMLIEIIHILDTSVLENLEKSVCEEPFSQEIKNKIQEVKNE